MRKYFCFGLMVSVLPSLCLAENPRITKLMREKQNKIEQLEKCMGSTKGLKIAGISTLGLTAVGVAGNIAEAKAIKDYDSQIESTDKKIEKTQAEIEEKENQIIENIEKDEKRKEAVKKAEKEGRLLSKVALSDIDKINRSGYVGDKAASHGYMPERLPDNLRTQFANAMVNFIERCRSVIGMNGIQEVSLSPTIQENWRQYLGSSPLAEDTILDDLNEHVIAECKITQCNLETHNPAFNGASLYCTAKPVVASNDANGGQAGDGNADGSAGNGQAGGQSGTQGQSGNGNQGAQGGNQGQSGGEAGNGNQGAQGGENGQAGNGNQGAGAGTTTKSDGTDCTADAQKTETDTEKAEYKGGVCKITKCKTATNEPNKDGNKCAAKTATKPDGTDCTADAQKTESDTEKAEYKSGVCKITKCKTSTNEPNKSGNKCVNKNSGSSKVESISQGDYVGSAVCSSTSGSTMGTAGNPDLTGSGDAKYCWCKVDKYKGQNINSKWLFGYVNSTAAECKEKCKNGCIGGVNNNDSGFRDLVLSSKEWTDAEKKKNPEGYCSTKYKTDAAKACCMEIHSKNRATGWNGQTCSCKSEYKWENNECISNLKDVEISDFQTVQVGNLSQCQSLVRLYSKERGLDLTYKSKNIKSGDDYLTYEDKDKRKYIFHFDDCNEAMPKNYRGEVLKALCNIYGGTHEYKACGVHKCEVSKSADEINRDLASFNSHYTYGTFPIDTSCKSTTETATGFRVKSN